jgi:hypothetical protein
VDDREAQEIVRLVESYSRADFGREGRGLWKEMLYRYDVDIATKAVVKLSQQEGWPTIAALKAAILQLKAEGYGREEQAAPSLPPGRTPSRELPMWVKRWTAARYLYGRFGREQDMRIFPEQRDSHALGEMMPAGEWVEEGAKVRDKDVWQAIA